MSGGGEAASVAGSSLGVEFAEALAAKDFDRAGRLFDPEIDFRGLTPNRTWEASSAAEIVTEILPLWFEPSDQIEELVSIEDGAVADRRRVAYLLRGRNPDGPFLVEQQAYFAVGDGRITWLRVLCSGFRPL